MADGAPKAWFTGVRKHSPHLLSDFAAFRTAFKTHFGDPDYKGTAIRKLRALKQTGSCAQYAAPFREIVVALDLSEFSLCDDFYKGLKEEVKNIVVAFGKPDTLNTMERKAIEIDNHLYARRVEKAKAPNPIGKGLKPPSRPNSPPSHPITLPTTSPSTDVDVARRGPLSNEEKQRRRVNNLCLYCGAVGHLANTCSKIQRSKPNASAFTKLGKAKSEAH